MYVLGAVASGGVLTRTRLPSPPLPVISTQPNTSAHDLLHGVHPFNIALQYRHQTTLSNPRSDFSVLHERQAVTKLSSENNSPPVSHNQSHLDAGLVHTLVGPPTDGWTIS